MLHKLDKDQGKKYTFIVKSNWVDKIVSKEQTFSNDVFIKYKASLNNLEGELIICSDITKPPQLYENGSKIKHPGTQKQEPFEDYFENKIKREYYKI